MSKFDFSLIQNKIYYYASAISLVLLGILFEKQTIIVASKKITEGLGCVLLLASYYMFLRIARDLKKQGIHGLWKIMWAALMIYQLRIIISSSSNITIVWEVVQVICLYFYMFCGITGFIQLLFSLVQRWSEFKKSNQGDAETMESIVAIITSMLAIILTGIGLMIV